jgi:hypothetical protein
MTPPMNADFIQDVIEDEPRGGAGSLTGWETIVFELEDEPEPAPD